MSPKTFKKKNTGKNNAGGGDGSTLQDIVINAGCRSVGLRSERLGGGNGRVYTIHVAVRDPSSIAGGSGNLATATFVVQVPRNEEGAVAADDGVAYSVTSSCEGNLAAQSAPTSQESPKPLFPVSSAWDRTIPTPSTEHDHQIRIA